VHPLIGAGRPLELLALGKPSFGTERVQPQLKVAEMISRDVEAAYGH
jgi:hypothetical protein